MQTSCKNYFEYIRIPVNLKISVNPLSGMMNLLEFTFWETIFSLTLQIDRKIQF